MNIMTGPIRIMKMNQGKGFAMSIVIHLLVLMMIYSTTSKIEPAASQKVVDLSILKSIIQNNDSQHENKTQPISTKPTQSLIKPDKLIPTATPTPVPTTTEKLIQTQKVVAKTPKPIPVKKIELAEKTRPKISSIPKPELKPVAKSEKSAPEHQTKKKKIISSNNPDTPPAFPARKLHKKSLPTTPAPSTGIASDSNDLRKINKYTKTQFNRIQQNIQQHIVYPRSARRMGWEGKVVVEFVICEDGTVKNFHILESSGFKLLDKNAIATIKKTAPYPIPPIPAKLKISVIYRLS